MNDGNGKYNGNGHDPDDNIGHDDDNVVQMPTLAERDRMRRAQKKEQEKQEKLWRKQYRAANHEQMINLPPATKILTGLLLAIHLVMALALTPPQQYWVMEHFGFIPAYYTVHFPGLYALAGPLTYMLIHGSWLHIGMNGVMLAAFGAGIEKWLGGKRMLVLFVACSLAAALIQLALAPHSNSPMVGASGGISGLFAAALILFQMQGRMGTGKYGILPFAALWIGISVIFGMLGGPDGSTIAWAAHIGGFLAGFILIKPVMKIKP